MAAMKVAFLRLLDHPRLPVIAVLVAVVLCLPVLQHGFLADDWFHRAVILGWKGEVDLPLFTGDPPRHPLTGLFVFFDGQPEGLRDLGELGLLPWWAAPTIKASFLRPLTVCTHLLDYFLWPDSPRMMHLHSLAWMGLCVLAAAALFRRFAVKGTVVGLATLLFAVQDHHATPALWIANRNSLVALCLVAVSLLLHDDWRRQGRRWAAPLAVVVFGLSLLAGEAALAGGALLVAYLLFVDAGSPWSRAGSLAAYVPVTAGWAAWYVLGNFGTAGAQSYVSPVSLDFPRALAERIPVLLGGHWAKLPSDAWIAIPPKGQVMLLGASLVVVVGLFWLFAPVVRARSRARFWALAMVLACVPICASFPMDRLLLFVGLAAAGLLAEALDHAGWLQGPMIGPRPRRWALGGVLLLHLGLSPLLLPAKVMAFGMALKVFERAASYAPTDAALEDQRLVWVNGATMFSGFVPVLRALNDDPVPLGQWTLAHMMTDMDIERVDEHTLVATAPAGFLATPPEQLVRDPTIPFEPGWTKDHAGMTVTVEQVMPDGRPRMVRFELPVDLDDPGLRWVVWRETRLFEFVVPAVGETVHVDPSWPPFLP